MYTQNSVNLRWRVQVHLKISFVVACNTFFPINAYFHTAPYIALSVFMPEGGRSGDASCFPFTPFTVELDLFTNVCGIKLKRYIHQGLWNLT